MTVVGLTAVFAFVARPVLRASIRTVVTPPPAAAGARLDAAIDRLRHDVWRAATLTASSPHELTLTGIDGHAVAWHVGPGDRFQRDGQAWPGLFPDATVAVQGAAVRVTFPDGPGFRGCTVTLASQAAMLRRRP